MPETFFLHRKSGEKKQLRDQVTDPLSDPDELLALDEALADFATERPEMAELVKLRYFAGLSIPQVASALGISTSTANRHWRYARAWLYRRLKPLGFENTR